MKRNLLNGAAQNGLHDHEATEKQEILDFLQKTVLAQEKRMTEMADDIKYFKSVEQLSSQGGKIGFDILMLPGWAAWILDLSTTVCVVDLFSDFPKICSISTRF